LNLFKERELFTVAQLYDVEERFKGSKEEKDRIIALLKDEIEEIKGHNLLLSKLKS
jgi:hypothetical protein